MEETVHWICLFPFSLCLFECTIDISKADLPGDHERWAVRGTSSAFVRVNRSAGSQAYFSLVDVLRMLQVVELVCCGLFFCTVPGKSTFPGHTSILAMSNQVWDAGTIFSNYIDCTSHIAQNSFGLMI